MDIRTKLFGYVLGDGWIDKRGNGGISGEAESLRQIIADINTIYGEGSTGRIRTCNTYSASYDIAGVTSQFTIHTAVTKDLLSLGMPQGKRVYTDYKLPLWLMEGNKEIKASFISGYYAADGMIPSLQSNQETPKPLSMCFYKNHTLELSGDRLAEQFSKIVEDLGFTLKVKKSCKWTGDKRIVYTMTINNQRDEFLQQLRMLDLNYCKYREQRRLQLIRYFELKQQQLQELRDLRDKVQQLKREGLSYKQIMSLTNLSYKQIGRMLTGHNKCNRIVGFPKFNQEFIDTYM